MPQYPSATTGPERRVTIEVRSEVETEHGWRYDLTVRDGTTEPRGHVVDLSWIDHDHLTGGTTPPSITVQTVAAVASERLGGAMPRRFDVSNIRRLIDDFDNAVRDRLH